MSRYDGKTTRRRFRKLRIDEISVVDQPAHGPALIAIMKRATDPAKDSELSPEDGASASRSDKGQQAANTTAKATEADGNLSPETEMSEKNDNAEAEAAEAVQKQLAELTTKNDRLSAVVALSPEQRAHFDSLEGGAADDFLKSESKDEILKNEQSEDPVVYTNLDGREFKKSSDPVVLDLVKSNDELRKAAIASELVAKRADLVKRAGEELEHLTGESDAKADLLGAVDSLSVEKREAVLAILKTKDAGMSKAMETIGTSATGGGASAHQKIEAIAKRLSDADSTLTKAKAYVAALDTPEGRELQSQLV